MSRTRRDYQAERLLRTERRWLAGLGRYPFDVVEECVMIRSGPRLDANGEMKTARRIVAEALGEDPAQIDRWRQNGVTMDQAERVAWAMGMHPFEVWPQLRDDLIAALDRAEQQEGMTG